METVRVGIERARGANCDLVIGYGGGGALDYGLTTAEFPLLIRNAAKASSMKGNPIRLTERAMEEILLCAL